MSFFLPPKVSVPLDSLPEASTRPLPKSQPSSHRVSSLGAWFRAVLPSQRPERGGTRRTKGYWEQAGSISRRRSHLHRTLSRSESISGRPSTDPNKLVRWNTAKELPTLEPPRIKLHTPSPAVLAYNEPLVPSRAPAIPANRHMAQRLSQHDPRTVNGTTDSRQLPDQTVVTDNPSNSPNVPSVLTRKETVRLLHAKRESRRQRRLLKASGDYLGVQGANPNTGRLDIITPTDSERSAASEDLPSIQHKKKTSARVPSQSDEQAFAARTRMSRLSLVTELKKLQRADSQKQRLEDLSKTVNWRRHTKQWSSVQEPNLSPVAQSQNNGQVDKVRNGLPIQGSQGSKMPVLIDFDSSTGDAALDRSQPEQGSITEEDETSSTQGTVVRTPHRQSVARISPSATELYENGITFQRSETSLRHEPAPSRTAETGGRCQGEKEPHKRQVQLPEQDPTCSVASEDLSSKLEATGPYARDRDSFLAIGREGDFDPGGNITKCVNIVSQTLLNQQLKESKSKCDALLGVSQSGNPPRVRRTKSCRRQKLSTMEATAKGGDPARLHKTVRPPAGHLSRELTRRPSVVNLLSKGSKDRKPWNQTEGSRLDEVRQQVLGLVERNYLHPMTTSTSNLENEPSQYAHHNPPDHHKTQMEGATQKTTSLATHHVETMHMVEQKQTMSRLSTVKHLNRFGGAVQNVSTKSREQKIGQNLRVPVFTRTTIITGSDHKTSSLSQNLKVKGDGGSQMKPKSPKVYQLVDLAPTDVYPEISFRGCRVKQSPNMLPNLEREAGTETTDVTSAVFQKFPGHNRAPREPESSARSTREHPLKSPPAGPQPTFTSVIKSIDHHGKRNKVSSVHPTIQLGTLPAREIQERENRATASKDDTGALMGQARCCQSSELHLAIYIPGSYPIHPVDEGIADLSAPNLNNEMEENLTDLSLATVKTTAKGFVIFVMAALRLYWHFCRPVLMVNSGYWVRSRNNKLTTRDAAVTIAALPGIIVLMAILIWAIRAVAVLNLYICELIRVITDE